MSEIEFAIWIMAFIIIWLPILSNLIWWWDDRKDPENIGNNWEKYHKQAENNTKLNKKLVKIKRELKKQLLQKQIKEKEIEKLEEEELKFILNLRIAPLLMKIKGKKKW